MSPIQTVHRGAALFFCLLWGAIQGSASCHKDTSACRCRRLGMEPPIFWFGGRPFSLFTALQQLMIRGMDLKKQKRLLLSRKYIKLLRIKVLITKTMLPSFWQIRWKALLSCISASFLPRSSKMALTRGGCGWGVEWSSPNLKVGRSIPSLPNLHAEVSLGKMLNPELPLMEQQLLIDALYECVCEWVNVKLYCKELWVVIKTRKALYKYKTIYHLQNDWCRL